MDRFEAMGLLSTAVESGSFSAAGRKLGIPLPTVSRKIAELEAQLGARLLTRSTRRLSLTEAGEAYLSAARRILDQLDEAERAAAGEYQSPKGGLVLTAPLVFGRLEVLPIVAAFLTAYPEIQVRMVLSDRNLHLIDEHIDIAVRVGELPDSVLTASRIGGLRRVACASPAFWAAHGVPKSPADLSALPCVTFEGLAGGAAWSFAKGAKLVPTPMNRCRLTVDSADAAVQAAIAGLGVTHVLSYQAAQALQTGRLQAVLADFEPLPLPVSLIHAGQGLLPLKTRKFLDFAVPALRRSLAQMVL